MTDAMLVLDDSYFQCPQRLEAALRASAPARLVLLPTGNRGWLITRHDDVRDVLVDPRVKQDSATMAAIMQRNRVRDGQPPMPDGLVRLRRSE